MEENSVVALSVPAAPPVGLKQVERLPVEGVMVAMVRQHVVTIRVDIDGRPVEASFFIEDLSQDTGRAFIKDDAPIVSARSCVPDTPSTPVGLPHAVIERIRARLARVT